jgi:hypothetical protein
MTAVKLLPEMIARGDMQKYILQCQATLLCRFISPKAIQEYQNTFSVLQVAVRTIFQFLFPIAP